MPIVESPYGFSAGYTGGQSSAADGDDKPSATGAFVRGAVRAAAPTAVGLVTGVGTTIAATPALTPVGGLAAGVGTGMAAGYATGAAQQKLFEEYPRIAAALGQSPEQVQADITAHPTAALAGEFSPGFLAFRPSISAFPTRSLAGKSEAAAQAIKQARVQATIGAGIGATTDVVGQKLVEGRDELDLQRLAMATGAGALQQKPTKYVGEPLTRLARAPISQSVLDRYDAQVGAAPPAAQRRPTAPPLDTSSQNIRRGETFDMFPDATAAARQDPEALARLRELRARQGAAEDVPGEIPTGAMARPQDDVTQDIFADTPTATVGSEFGAPKVFSLMRRYGATENSQSLALAKMMSDMLNPNDGGAAASKMIEGRLGKVTKKMDALQEDLANGAVDEAQYAKRLLKLVPEQKLLSSARRVVTDFRDAVTNARVAETKADDARAARAETERQSVIDTADGARSNADTRTAILNEVMADPDTQNIGNRFRAALRAAGIRELTVLPEEAARIAKFEELRDTFDQPFELTGSPDEDTGIVRRGEPEQADRRAPLPEPNKNQGELFTPGGKPTRQAMGTTAEQLRNPANFRLEPSPSRGGRMTPEPVETPAVPERNPAQGRLFRNDGQPTQQAMRNTEFAPTRSRSSAEPAPADDGFRLTSPTPDDFPARGDTRAPAPVVERNPAQGEMFTKRGDPTKQAMGESKQQLVNEANSLLRTLKGKKALDVMDRAVNSFMRNEIDMPTVRQVHELLSVKKFKDAERLLKPRGDEPPPEPTPPATPPPAPVDAAPATAPRAPRGRPKSPKAQAPAEDVAGARPPETVAPRDDGAPAPRAPAPQGLIDGLRGAVDDLFGADIISKDAYDFLNDKLESGDVDVVRSTVQRHFDLAKQQGRKIPTRQPDPEAQQAFDAVAARRKAIEDEERARKKAEQDDDADDGVPDPLAEYESVRLARQMSELRDTKPRPLKKMFGNNPTGEQKATHQKLVNEWQRKYAKLSGEHKKALERENADFTKRQQADLSRSGEPRSTGMKTDDVQSLVDTETADWKNKPKIVVVESADQLPPDVPIPGDTDGAYVRKTGTVYLLAKNLKDPAHVRSVLFHESLGHYGLQGKFAKALNKLMLDVFDSNAKVRQLAEQWIARQMRDPVARDYYSKVSPRMMQRMAAEEVLAMASEGGAIGRSGLKGAYDQVVGLIRQFARDMGFEVRYSDADVREILRQAHRHVTDGAEGGPVASLRNLAADALSRRTQEETPEFKRWFGDSKVVDADGRPLVVYHGMPGEMEGGAFRESSYGSLGKGIYFTSDPEVAGRFATGVRGDAVEPKLQGSTVPVYLKMNQPFDDAFFVGNKPWQEWAASVLTRGRDDGWDFWWPVNVDQRGAAKALHTKLMQGTATLRDLLFFGKIDSETPWGKELLSTIKSHGAFDGIVLKDSPKGFDEYVVFSPEQIKSAIGNRGTFDPANPDITLSRRTQDLSDLSRLSDEQLDSMLGQLKEQRLGLDDFRDRADPIIAEQARRTNQRAISAPATKVAEFVPGFKKIPVGTKVAYDISSGTDKGTGTGVVVDHRTNTINGELTYYPRVQLENGRIRRLSAEQVKEVYAPRGVEPSEPPAMLSRRTQEETPEFRRVSPGDTVDGRVVRKSVPNTDSIGASLENYEVMPGIREVPVSAFDPEYVKSIRMETLEKRTRELARDIEESGEITPLIVVKDAEGLYVLEGGHRFDALIASKAKSLPAVVVIDQDSPPAMLSRQPHEPGSQRLTVDPTPENRRRAMTDPATMETTASDWWTNLKGTGRRTVLKLMDQSWLADKYHGDIPQLPRFNDMLLTKKSLSSSLMQQASRVYAPWKNLSAEESAAVNDLLLDASRDKVDLTKPDGEGPLFDRYYAMSREAQNVYDSVRGVYEQQFNLAKDTIKQFINDDESMTPDEKAAAIKEVDTRFHKSEGYFPFERFGDFLTIAESAEYTALRKEAEALEARMETTRSQEKQVEAAKKLREVQKEMKKLADAGERSVIAHETEAEMIRTADELKGQGYTVRQKLAHEFDANTDGVSDTFMRKVNASLDSMASKNPDDAKGILGMKSMLNQMYISMMPAGSALKRQLQRKNVAGYSEDAQRVFAATTMRNANYLAELKHGHNTRKLLNEIGQTVRDKSIPVQEVYQQLRKNYNALQDHSQAPILDFMKNASYVYMLGASPSFTMMHLMQLPLIGTPLLTGKHNPVRVAPELLRAGRDVIDKYEEGMASGDDMAFGKNLGEREMLRYLRDRTTFDATEVREFMNASKGGNGVGDAIMHYATLVPHHTERFNRLTMALAAYRLAMADKKLPLISQADFDLYVADHPQANITKKQLTAAMYAEKMVQDTNVNYSEENAAYFMKKGGPGSMRPIFSRLTVQFLKYQYGMFKILAQNAGKLKNPAERAAAARTLAGIFATHTTMTGLMGAPFAGAMMLTFNLLQKMFGDPDDPIDAETRFRNALADSFGSEAGDVLARGALRLPGVRDVLPVDITGRVGLGDLLVGANRGAESGIDKANTLAYIASVVGGPAISLIGNMADGIKQMGDGEFHKGLEAFMPKVVRDISKGVRYMESGVTTAGGKPVLEASDLSAGDAMAQFVGFQSQKVESAFAQRGAFQRTQTALQKRRSKLLRAYARAQKSGDVAAIETARQNILQYNQTQQRNRNYSEILSPRAMARATRQNRTDLLRLQNGLSPQPRERALMENYADFAYDEDEEE